MSPKLAYTSSPKIAGFSKTIALSEDLVIGNLSKNELRNGDLSLGGMEGRPTGLVWEVNSEEEPEGGKKKESLSEEVVAEDTEKLVNIPSPDREFEPREHNEFEFQEEVKNQQDPTIDQPADVSEALIGQPAGVLDPAIGQPVDVSEALIGQPAGVSDLLIGQPADGAIHEEQQEDVKKLTKKEKRNGMSNGAATRDTNPALAAGKFFNAKVPVHFSALENMYLYLLIATTVLLIRIFPDKERAKWPHNRENEEISCFERLGCSS